MSDMINSSNARKILNDNLIAIHLERIGKLIQRKARNGGELRYYIPVVISRSVQSTLMSKGYSTFELNTQKLKRMILTRIRW